MPTINRRAWTWESKSRSGLRRERLEMGLTGGPRAYSVRQERIGSIGTCVCEARKRRVSPAERAREGERGQGPEFQLGQSVSASKQRGPRLASPRLPRLAHKPSSSTVPAPTRQAHRIAVSIVSSRARRPHLIFSSSILFCTTVSHPLILSASSERRNQSPRDSVAAPRDSIEHFGSAVFYRSVRIWRPSNFEPHTCPIEASP